MVFIQRGFKEYLVLIDNITADRVLNVQYRLQYSSPAGVRSLLAWWGVTAVMKMQRHTNHRHEVDLPTALKLHVRRTSYVG